MKDIITDNELRDLRELQSTLTSVHNDVIDKLIDYHDNTKEVMKKLEIARGAL